MGRCLALILLCCQLRMATAGDSIDFESDVLPILRSACADCHSGDERNGGIAVDDLPSLFREADSGQQAIVPGDVGASELMLRLTATDEDLRMPPEGERLPAEQLQVIEAWIAGGARSTAASRMEQTPQDAHNLSSHWAFQPVQVRALPEVGDPSWPWTPIDVFVQSGREAAGLEVADDALPRTLVRRAHYALTGLPPTAEAIETFQQNSQLQGVPRALSQLIDQLLQERSYGERWGRHWMDWVRYADTAGDNSDFPIPQAFLYRNYIIDSLNADLPYDRFLIEQLAGDLLPAEDQEERNRLTVATGYLAMARRFGSLIERYPWHLTIEDTIDNVGRTMMGVTLACARCHDHKFDPFSTRDYYALYGFFASTRYPQPGLELFQAQQHLVPLVPAAEVEALWASSQSQTRAMTDQLETVLAECDQMRIEHAAQHASWTVAEQRRAQAQLDKRLLEARKMGEKLAAHLKERPTVPTAYAVREGVPQDARIQIKGEPARPGAMVARRFPQILGGQPLPEQVAQNGSGRLELARWIASDANPLTARVIVNRVWERHFGTGIVSSTSDFGLRGQQPSHPELLDWLTADFIQHDWSLKHLHRRIMLSRTWQLASQDLPANLAIDPANTLLWKANRRRLDAESIRDSLLWLAGNLDDTPQQESYPIPPQKEWKYTQHHPFKDEYTSQKRSVYLMTKRLTNTTYFQTFDGPDPNVCTSSRDQSVTPLQALYFVNDSFFHQQAQDLAARLVAEFPDESNRLEAALNRLLGRPPETGEAEILTKHLQAARLRLHSQSSGNELEQRAWASLVRSLLRTNEFLYVE